MRIRKMMTVGGVSAALVLAGCGTSEPDRARGGGADTGQAGGAATLPASVWLEAKPAGAEPLTKVKASAKEGERVAFLAQVGGRAKPYVPGRAIVLVADPALQDCAEEEDDHCPTPWDYCCENPAALKAGTGAIQFIGGDGQPLHVSLEGMEEFSPLTTMYVTGTVSARDDEGTFTVDADGVFIVRAADAG